MFWLLLTLLLLLAAVAAFRKKAAYRAAESEPWRASLDDDELDMEEIRRAEDEWRESSPWEDQSEDESWR